MCGIFALVSKTTLNTGTVTRQALCDLEYRGYDSWGVCALDKDKFFLKKSVGKISESDPEDFSDVKGAMAIGHSRWATHGGVTEANAHPHVSLDKTVAVVHNGIIENYEVLRLFVARRREKSVSEIFVSETDTEVIPHLIEIFMMEGKSFEDAFYETGKMLDGRFAVVAVTKQSPYLMAMRKGSPLVLGKNDHGYFLASDVPAFLDHTRTVLYPTDETYIKISSSEVMVRGLQDRKKIENEWNEVTWDKTSATKEGYPHYMLKEIFEQQESIDRAIRQDEKKINALLGFFKKKEHLFFIGCGTAGKMAKLGEMYFAKLGNVLGQSFVGSEFGPYQKFLDKKSLIIAVSQSGETADVLEAIAVGKKQGAQVVSLLNVVDSSMDRMSDESIFIHAGPEIAVASTKAATAQIALLLLLAYARGGRIAEGKHLLRKAVKLLGTWLTTERSHDIASVAFKLKDSESLYIIGRGYNAPIAHEGAIKIQEVSYIHAEGFPGGELKHGPIALIEKGTPVIALIANDETRRDMESNTTELKARGAYIIGISPDPSPLFDEWIQVPDLGDASPIASIIPIQLLAYHLALIRGNDPDKPRNLAKSVTVK